MKKLSLLFIGFLLIPALFLTSCDRGEEPGGEAIITPPFELLKDHMITSNLDIDKILMSPDGKKFVVGAPATAGDVDAFLATYYILDIRNSDAFNAGHVQGAKNIAFGNILTEAANSGGKSILMVCYTGQTACYATSLLRLYGYSNAQALKWGMSGWNDTTSGSWDNNTGDIAENHTNWSYTAAPSAEIFKDPVLGTISQDGAEILKVRVEEVVAAGFKTASNIDVLDHPANYFVNNYFSAIDYADFGHINDAYRVKEELLLVGNGYLGINPDANAKVVSYCYTGQTSAVLTAWLNVLGYDAYSLTFGMNGLNHSNNAWDKANLNQWGVGSHPKNYPLK